VWDDVTPLQISPPFYFYNLQLHNHEMPALGEPEEWASSGSSSSSEPNSPISKAIDVLNRDPKLSKKDAAKMFNITRVSIWRRLKGLTQSATEASKKK
jgi:hypothetical protein